MEVDDEIPIILRKISKAMAKAKNQKQKCSKPITIFKPAEAPLVAAPAAAAGGGGGGGASGSACSP